MLQNIILFILSSFIVSADTAVEWSGDADNGSGHHVNTISDQVLALVEHFKHPDPVGLPGVEIPEPLFIPKIPKENVKDILINGLSEFKIEDFQMNLDKMQFFSTVSFENITLQAEVKFTVFSSYTSRVTVKLTNVKASCRADLQIATNGDLSVREMNIINLNFGDSDIDFTPRISAFIKLGINLIAPRATEWIKQSINGNSDAAVQETNDVFRRLVKYTLPNSISPVDLAVAEGRKYVRNAGYDPYKIEDYKHSVGVFAINVSKILVSGLSTFYRTGDLTLAMKNNTLHLEMHVSTKRLQGLCEWELSVGGFLSRYGSSSFSVEHLILEIKLSQSLDVREKPKLDELEMNIGNIQLRMEGIGSMDYLLEFVVNILPNILRFQIVEVIEAKLKNHLKEIFDSMDIEKEIENLLPTLEYLTSANKTISMQLNPPESSPDIDIYEEIAL